MSEPNGIIEFLPEAFRKDFTMFQLNITDDLELANDVQKKLVTSFRVSRITDFLSDKFLPQHLQALLQHRENKIME